MHEEQRRQTLLKQINQDKSTYQLHNFREIYQSLEQIYVGAKNLNNEEQYTNRKLILLPLNCLIIILFKK